MSERNHRIIRGVPTVVFSVLWNC